MSHKPKGPTLDQEPMVISDAPQERERSQFDEDYEAAKADSAPADQSTVADEEEIPTLVVVELTEPEFRLMLACLGAALGAKYPQLWLADPTDHHAILKLMSGFVDQTLYYLDQLSYEGVQALREKMGDKVGGLLEAQGISREEALTDALNALGLELGQDVEPSLDS